MISKHLQILFLLDFEITFLLLQLKTKHLWLLFLGHTLQQPAHSALQ